MHKPGFHWLAATPIYSRDFAYPGSQRRRIPMAGDISTTTATVFAELLSGPTVAVRVGPARRAWTLHANLLAFHSERLRQELQEQWEAHASSPGSASAAVDCLQLDLPRHDPVGFELLVKWFYRGQLDGVDDIPDPRGKYDRAVACHGLYVLCEQFGMAALMDRAMDEYRKGLRDAGLVPDAAELAGIYGQSGKGSPFRRLMTRIAARQVMDPGSDKDAGDYRECFAADPDFAVGVINAIREETGGVEMADPTEGEGCEYHGHGDGALCRGNGKGW
jgi:hypothetical protein